MQYNAVECSKMQYNAVECSEKYHKYIISSGKLLAASKIA